MEGKTSTENMNGRYDRLSVSLLAVLVGVATGLAGMLFNWSLDEIHRLLYGGVSEFLLMSRNRFLVIPMLAGLSVGLINMYLIKDDESGCGVTEVIEEIKLINRFLMKPKSVIIKMLATIITISGGLSAGRHGPIVHLGGAIGSNIGYRAGFSRRKIRILIGCGVAGSLAAVFDTPVFATLFVLEVMMNRDFFEYFTPIFISSITAAFIGRVIIGHTPFLVIEGVYGIKDYGEIGFYVLLGILMSIVSLAYICGLEKTKKFFREMTEMPKFAKPLFGATVVGIIGYFLPLIYDIEFNTIPRIVQGEFGMKMLMMLLVAKFIATFMTLGSGNIGGVFVPGLYIGATFGSIYGNLLERFFPEQIFGGDTYSIIGVGVMFASFAEAPIAASLMVVELTDNYAILFPALIACAVGSITTEIMHKYSIYTKPLKNNLIDIK